jgi:hypothetical protein
MVYTFGFAALEIPRHNHARRLLPYLSRHPGQEDFEWGLSWIIRGIVESAKKR